MTHFDGSTFNPERDGPRLTRQLDLVRRLMSDSQWRTLAEIGLMCGCPEASASARLRDLRRPRNGSYTVQREYVRNGLWKYRVLPSAVWLEENESSIGKIGPQWMWSDELTPPAPK